MRSLDTNVVVRLLVFDDAEQTAVAAAVIAEPALLLPTVLIELVWVLERSYRLPVAEVADNLEQLLRIGTLLVPDREAVVWAIRRFRDGADFADMLHLALSGAAQCFATFDRRVERHAEGAPVPVETLGTPSVPLTA